MALPREEDNDKHEEAGLSFSGGSEMCEWQEMGQFHTVGGDLLKISDSRWTVDGYNFCASVTDAPLTRAEGGVFRFEFSFRTEHFMIGVLDAKKRESIKGASWETIQQKGAWCLENVRRQRNLFLNTKFIQLFEPHGGESHAEARQNRPTGVELDKQGKVRVLVDMDAATITANRFERDEDTGEEVVVGEDWVVDGWGKAQSVWPVVCVFGMGSCRSYSTRTSFTKSARKR